MELGKREPALADFAEAIRLAPSLYEAYLRRGSHFFGEGEYDLAFADFAEAFRLNPCDEEAQYWRVRAYFHDGNFFRAIAELVEITRLNPCTFMAQRLLFDARMSIYWTIEDFAESIRLNPNDVWARYWRGWFLWADGELAPAIADFTEALRIEPDLVGARVSRGLAHLEGRDFDLALADFAEAIRLGCRFAAEFFLRAIFDLRRPRRLRRARACNRRFHGTYTHGANERANALHLRAPA